MCFQLVCILFVTSLFRDWSRPLTDPNFWHRFYSFFSHLVLHSCFVRFSLFVLSANLSALSYISFSFCVPSFLTTSLLLTKLTFSFSKTSLWFSIKVSLSCDASGAYIYIYIFLFIYIYLYIYIYLKCTQVLFIFQKMVVEMMAISSWKTKDSEINRCRKKHRRDGMSRLASSRNVQWSAEGATNFVYPRVQKQVDLSRFRSGKFDERKMNENIVFEKNEKRMFGKKRSRHTWWRKLW